MALSLLRTRPVHFYLFFIFLFSTPNITHANSKISFASFNLHCQFDDWRWRLNQVGLWLAQNQPAVVFFQEVCDGQGQSMTTEVPQILKSAGYWLSTSQALYAHDAWDGKYKEHLLVVTRFSNPQWFGGPLPGKGMRRIYLGLKVQDTLFIGVHLTSDPERPYNTPENIAEATQSRLEQINFLSAQFAQTPETPILFMGDFNSNPSDPEQRAFQNRGFHPYFPGPTEPNPHPKWAIDGAWITPGFQNKLVDAHIEKALEQPIQGRYLSDHTAVLFTVETR